MNSASYLTPSPTQIFPAHMPIWVRKASIGTITATMGAVVYFAQLELDGSEVGVNTVDA